MNTTHFFHVLLYERCVGAATESFARTSPLCNNESRSLLCLSVKLQKTTLSTQQLLARCEDMYVISNSVNCGFWITQLQNLQQSGIVASVVF